MHKFKGGEEDYFLAWTVLVVEGVPQFLLLGMVLTHWHGDFNKAALTFFVTFVDIPLIVWYLSFYCDERTKYVVIGKIIFLAMANSAEHWALFVESHIYDEIDIVQMDDSPVTEYSNRNERSKDYDVSNHSVVFYYQLGYILASPIIGKLKTVLLKYHLP